MLICSRSECQTTAGCANRGPKGELCVFSETGPFTKKGQYSDSYRELPGWLSIDAKPLSGFSDTEIEAEYHRRKLKALTPTP